MAKKNLCGMEIEYPENKEFHHDIFHCYGATSVDNKEYKDDTSNNFVTIESNDGKCAKIIAMCPTFDDAKAIVCAMGLSKKIMDANAGLNDIFKVIKSEMNEKLRKVGYNIEAMEAKMDELLKSGKSSDEILKYMNEHREDFIIKKTDVKPIDDRKERW